ncbi:MAG TPA: DUF4215 domain-containing protein [Candidatus Binatia bacterium]|nr:DUF4215 domain-containing protein [Candidatus Binatia bacterium]
MRLALFVLAVARVEAGWQYTGQPSTCTTVCGDGIIAGSEQCDDGNTTNGAGCSATCQFQCLGQACVLDSDCRSTHCTSGTCTAS